LNSSESSNRTKDQLGLKEPKQGPDFIDGPAWMVLVPFFLSAFFYFSTVLTIFAPLPLLLLFFKKGKGLATLALITNAVITLIVGNPVYLVCYLVFVGVPALVLPVFLLRQKTLEKSVFWSLFFMVALALGFAGAYAYYKQTHVLQDYIQFSTRVVDEVARAVTSTSEVVDSSDLEEWKENLRVEFPSALIILALVLIWSNLNLLLMMNPKGIRNKLGLDSHFFKKWKAPEFLVWPTIICGFTLVFNLGWVSDFGINLFKVLMTIYAFQGLSILGFVFDLWGIRGFFRILGYFLSVVLMLPLVLGLGFFDLWFDFRSKFRQS
jgi:hypothetical protein